MSEFPENEPRHHYARLLRWRGIFLFVYGALLAAACSDLSNLAARQQQIHDLSRYALAPVAELNPIPYSVAEIDEVRSAPFSELLFLSGDSLCGASGGNWVRNAPDPLTLYCVAPNGMPTETKSYAQADLGFSGWGYVSAVTADAQENLWIVYNTQSTATLVAISLITDLVQRSFPTAHLDLSFRRRLLTYGNGLLFTAIFEDGGGQLFLAIDPQTGAIVHNYEGTVFPALRDLESPLVDGSGSNNSAAIAVSGDSLLVRGPGNEAAVFSVSGGLLTGLLGGVPTGPLIGDAQAFFGVDSQGSAQRFTIPDTTVEQFRLDRAFAFSRNGARAVAHGPNMIWVYYSDGVEEGDLIGYDPDTLEPLDGFALPSEVNASIYEDLGADDLRPYGFAFDGNTFFVQSATDYGPSAQTRVHLVRHASGEMEGIYDVPGINASSICVFDGVLWTLEMPVDQNTNTLSGRPTLFALDPKNGLKRAEFVGPETTNGLAGIACSERGLTYSGEESRLWVETTRSAASQATRLAAMPLSSAGRSVAALGETFWMLDPKRNLLIVASLP